MMAVRIFPRGARGTWWIDVRAPGYRERRSLQTTDRKVALEVKRRYERRLAGLEAAPARPRSFAQFSKLWLEKKAISRRKSTVDGLRHTVAEVMPVLGRIDITEITRNHAREVARRLAAGGKGNRSAETVRRHLSYLQSLFGDAQEMMRDSAGRAVIQENPFSNKSKLIEGLVFAERVAPTGDPDGDPKPYPDDELAVMLERLPLLLDLSDWTKVLFGLEAGLRRSEVLGLHRSDLQLDRAWGRISRRISRGQVGEPKTRRSRRRFPLSDRLVASTRELIVEQELGALALFPARKRRKDGTGYEDAKRFGNRFAEALRTAGLQVADNPFHRLRHTYVSRLLAAGTAPYLVSKWAGHGSTAFTEEHYAEWIPGDEHRELVNRGSAGHELGTTGAQPRFRPHSEEG